MKELLLFQNACHWMCELELFLTAHNHCATSLNCSHHRYINDQSQLFGNSFCHAFFFNNLLLHTTYIIVLGLGEDEDEDVELVNEVDEVQLKLFNFVVVYLYLPN